MSKARDLANAGTALTTVSATELGYLDGVTSAVQTQINSKIGQSAAINPTIVDAKGDLISATAADTPARLAVGTNGQVLTADSTAATGIKWATVNAGSLVLITTLSPSAVATITADNIFTSTYDNYYIETYLEQTTNAVLYAQLRSGGTTLATNTYTSDSTGGTAVVNDNKFTISANTGSGASLVSSLKIYNPAVAKITMMVGQRMATVDNIGEAQGHYNSNASAYDGFLIGTSGGTMTGKIRIYGLAN